MTTILFDSREQLPLPIKNYPTELAGGDNWEEEGRGPCLPVGDYGVKGFSHWDNPAFIVERKSLSDLCGSLGNGRARFMREIEKMRGYRWRGLLIEATREQVESGDYRSEMKPQSILATLDALSVRTGLHVYWCGSPEGAAAQLESLVRQFVRGVEKEYKALSKAS